MDSQNWIPSVMICIPLVSNESGEEIVDSNERNDEQWVLVELQGKLHNIDGDGLCGIDLGTLEWVNVSSV